eukprot:scaffold16298_cov130-Amphora_coffeaeformis.AAC.1
MASERGIVCVCACGSVTHVRSRIVVNHLPDKVNPIRIVPDLGTSKRVDNGRPERSCRVDTTSRERYQDDMSEKDGKPNGEGRQVRHPLGERLAVHRRHADRRAQDQGTHEFQQESVALIESRVQSIGPKSKGRISNDFGNDILTIIIHGRHGSPQQQTSHCGTHKLGTKVAQHLRQFTFTNQEEAVRDGRVEMTTRDMAETVRLHQNTHAKGKGNGEDASHRGRRRSRARGKLFSCVGGGGDCEES